jgi:sec-independent protein translocase protein TatB
MNIFSNVGITELILILLLALLVVGPERLPELARKLGETLRDLRRAYDNLTSDLGPELQSIQKSAQELRDSVDSVRNIPQEAIKSASKAAGLDETIAELKDVQESLDQVSTTISGAGKMVKDPVGEAVSTARKSLLAKETPTDEASPAVEQAVDEATGTQAESAPKEPEQDELAELPEEPTIAPPHQAAEEPDSADSNQDVEPGPEATPPAEEQGHE